MIWHGKLTDTRKYTYGGQEFYIPVDERELGSILILFILVPSPRDTFPCVIDANIKINKIITLKQREVFKNYNNSFYFT